MFQFVPTPIFLQLLPKPIFTGFITDIQNILPSRYSRQRCIIFRMGKTKGGLKKSTATKKTGQKVQHFKHVSFLLQCAEFTDLPDGLRHRYSYLAKKVSDKIMVRLHKSYKRRYCQRCSAEYTESLVLKQQKDYIKLTCEKCYYSKNYPVKELTRKKKIKK